MVSLRVLTLLVVIVASCQAANLRKSIKAQPANDDAAQDAVAAESRSDSQDTDAVAAATSNDDSYDHEQAASDYGGGYGGGGYGGGYGGGGGGGYGGGYGSQTGPGYYGPESYGDYGYGFECAGKKPAFYGDSKQDCKVFYICQSDGRTDTFRCPKWTRFNNYLGICDWHFKVDNGCNPLDTYEQSYGNNYGGGYSGGNSYGGGGYSKGGYRK
ncbi:keratin-associated protein 6-2-like [Paramacrobiotus metropolitanus]|uniref:keratin-associated protein 6-2-like n=1 Tax=Paramacrobiotus metropolitanus TaxID=2943436 RepID=UPI0024465D7A|nr:keratin-associated protein 6-2-like [Paramacrobiotus metropolitanus]